MKEHAKKIGEGFSGLVQDLWKRIVHVSFQIHRFLGKTGWIVVGGVIIVWILLAVYTHRIERVRLAEYTYDIGFRPLVTWRDDGWIRDMYRDMQRMQERMERTRAYYDKVFSTAFTLPSHKANYQKYLRSDSEKGTYSITYDDGKLQGFIQGGDDSKLSSLADALQKQGMQVEKHETTVFFSGEIKDIQPILNILKQ